MSEMIRKLQTTSTGCRAIKDNSPAMLVSEISEMCTDSDLLGLQDEYIIKAEVKTIFRANRAEYRRAYEYAVKNLAYQLYRDVHEAIHEINHALYSGDVKAALSAVKELESKITT